MKTETMEIIYVDAQGMEERLRSLSVPEGMEVQLHPISAGETELAAAFQAAIEQSEAKYKIYISSDIEILQKEILAELITAFRAHPEVGVLGLSGTKRILTSGITYNSPQRRGVVLDVKRKALTGAAAAEPCETVQALDSYFLATQYDVPWRKDILQGVLFLGASACCEQRRAGHEAAVLAQKQPACRMISSQIAVNDEMRAAFLDEYSKDLYPLVSIVIPTYQRPDYFRPALESAQKQTYRNLDIFVTDNSHNDKTEEVYKKYFADDPRITYEHHTEFNAKGNWYCAMAYDNPKAEYVNWLMDDDIFAPKKIATMMDFYFTYPDVTIVTSYRSLIDEKGNVLPDKSWSKPICKGTSRLSGDEVGRLLLQSTINYLGEPTTALLRKKYMLGGGRLGWTGKEGKYQISDFPTWFCLMAQGDLIYITEPLSSFRQHDSQQHQNLDTHFGGLICWTMMIQAAIERNVFLQKDIDKRKAIIQWLKYADENVVAMKDYPKDVWERTYVQDFLKAYAGMAASLSNGYHVEYNIDTTRPKGIYQGDAV